MIHCNIFYFSSSLLLFSIYLFFFSLYILNSFLPFLPFHSFISLSLLLSFLSFMYLSFLLNLIPSFHNSISPPFPHFPSSYLYLSSFTFVPFLTSWPPPLPSLSLSAVATRFNTSLALYLLQAGISLEGI